MLRKMELLPSLGQRNQANLKQVEVLWAATLKAFNSWCDDLINSKEFPDLEASLSATKRSIQLMLEAVKRVR